MIAEPAEPAEHTVDTRQPGTESCAALTNSAVDALPEGGSFLLIADHDPRPLRYMLDAERSGQVSWQPLEDGPERWQVRVGRIVDARRG